MRHLSLFSGILGIDLAGSWAGMESVAFCEREPFPRKVITKHFPGRPIYDDVCTLTREVLERDGIIGTDRAIDIISAGFPCQPFSHAGKRGGADDERYLWPEVVRVVADIRPRWFLGENVAGLLSMAEPDGDIEVESRTIARTEEEDFYEAIFTQQETMLLGRICQDLKDIDYEVIVFSIPAAAVGASHPRDRIIILGYTEHDGSYGTKIGRGVDPAGYDNEKGKDEASQPKGASRSGSFENVGYSKCSRCNREPWRGAEQESSDGYLQYGSEVMGNASSAGFPQRGQPGILSTGTEKGARLESEPKRSGKDVADASSERFGETRGYQCKRPQERTAGSGANVADAEREYQGGLSFRERTQDTGFTCFGKNVAHTCSPRQQECNPSAVTDRSRFDSWRNNEEREFGTTQSRVGGMLDELSAWLDGRGINPLDSLSEFVANYPQPALMGQPQYEWEPPRIANGIKNRIARLKALGNAVDPLQFFPVMAAIKVIDSFLSKCEGKCGG
ncbi:DNA cytosine methyltransferase [Paenibacillus bouchesdurhonensis]|uniref:DNA cytosine methyltransferase n=1 Tax=Paenibacillus bouchesdurhonensis TaxID=1870990 RepID=UPI000DA61E1B|nr:DNA cytosine methyltransferase [Paenibacillus bouchesdurhonensis]